MQKANDKVELSSVSDVELVQQLQQNMLEDDAVDLTAEFFKALADPTRIHIVNALQLHEWLCVSDLAAILGMSKSAISHQLSYLRLNKLVRVKRMGKRAFYALDDDHVKQVFAMAVSHITEQEE
ncbi:MAG: metalloregulator ArsR/SmtB family transcription factor [Candidatus Anaerobiospirillum merdipullorum]|uniref:Metalloregulator ArsR/SmtB family transcription factor n=1 Tax=Candidatus Anaerobiospirillum merdipullorum TaxID=2838450 RepID=A0A9E2KM32_9GAMM|nr:metalloregulator ArsR/SmtB family transcription factor [Candidatus Anaerobiospirillum merdipullorum]